MDDYLERIIPCPNCEGTGKEECLICDGDDEQCEICDGEGAIDCDMCGGDGQFYQNTETGETRRI